MSRSNHNYFKICDGPVNAEGYCAIHAGSANHRRRCLVEGDVITRRTFYRRKRHPYPGLKTIKPAPPRRLRRTWHKRARTRQKTEFLKNPQDPVITPFDRLIELWVWY